MAGTILLGQLMPGETAEQLCKALGSREVERANVSASVSAVSARSTTLSYSRDELALYKPSELSSRLGLTPDGRGVRMALCMAGNAYELFWPIFDMPHARPAHVGALWTQRFMFDPVGRNLAPGLVSQAGFGEGAGNIQADDSKTVVALPTDARDFVEEELSPEDAAVLSDVMETADETDDRKENVRLVKLSMPTDDQIAALIRDFDAFQS